MSRKASEIKAQIDAINRKRRAIDAQIKARREDLAKLNKEVDALTREHQSVFAAEQQAALAGKTPDTPTH